MSRISISTKKDHKPRVHLGSVDKPFWLSNDYLSILNPIFLLSSATENNKLR
jgi:hypothetical protein